MPRPAGFSLLEIMVGLAIGMLAVIVMMQVFALSEGRKRTTTSSGDAQSNGAIMLNQLQRDISQAGYGLSAAGLFKCNATWQVTSGGNIAKAVPLAPVTINPVDNTGAALIPAADLNTDTLLVMYGSSNGEPQGNPITSQVGTVYTVQMPSAFTAGAVGVGDRVIAAPVACGAANLVLDRITAVAPPTAASTVTVATGAAGTILYNLGPAPTVLAYAIRGGNLTVCDYMANDCGNATYTTPTANASVWVPIASNIVSMRAVYGRDTLTGISTTAIQSANVDTWDQAQPINACLWTRVPAISLVLVARSSQYEKDIVTTTATNPGSPVNAPTWTGNTVAPIVAATGALGPNAAADEPWKHYRYKVFQTVIPIRNVAWLGVPAGC